MSNGIISYTGRDIQSLRNNLVNMIQALDNNVWTDFNESDIGQAFIEIAAGLGDMLGFYLDKQALETYIDSVKQRRNGIAILGLVGYVPAMTNSCVTTGTIELSGPQSQDIVIPKYTKFSGTYNNSTINYYTKDNAIISAGDTQIDIPLVEGILTRAYSNVGVLKTSQKIYINSEDVARNSVRVIVGDDEWTQIENVLYDDTASTTFSVYEDKDCKPYVLFNNSWLSLLPDDNKTQVQFIYLTSSGAYGKITKNVLTSLDKENISYADGTPLSDGVIKYATNNEVSSGGSERETLDHARTYAPHTFRMLGKAIVLSDFYYMTMSLPGVLKCRAVDWSIDDSAYVEDPYRVLLYIVPSDGGECSSEFLNEIVDYFMNEDNHRALSSVRVEAQTAIYHTVDISATIYTSVASNEINELRSEILSVINKHFDPANLSFGDGVARSNIIALIQDSSPKVIRLTLGSPTEDAELSKIQFPKLGSVDLKFITYNDSSIDEEAD